VLHEATHRLRLVCARVRNRADVFKTSVLHALDNLLDRVRQHDDLNFRRARVQSMFSLARYVWALFRLIVAGKMQHFSFAPDVSEFLCRPKKAPPSLLRFPTVQCT
jgi:hypothetical protein